MRPAEWPTCWGALLREHEGHSLDVATAYFTVQGFARFLFSGIGGNLRDPRILFVPSSRLGVFVVFSRARIL